MSRLIDSEATEKEMLFWADTYGYGGLTKDNIREILRDSKKTPTVDAVEVIRCSQCARHEVLPNAVDICKKLKIVVNEKHYCGYAERREDEQSIRNT